MESHANKGTTVLIKDQTRIQINDIEGLTPGIYYPKGKRIRPINRLRPPKSRRRIVMKNGNVNILKPPLWVKPREPLQDVFNSLVASRWRWTLFSFATSFILSWLAFACVWWLMAYVHGDLEPAHLPANQKHSSWTPCVTEIHNFTSCFLFSIETQHTIGYGSRLITEECPEGVFVMCVQGIVGDLMEVLLIGIIFAKMARPKQRGQALIFSKKAVISHKNGDLCLMFRVGDMRKSNIIGADVRAAVVGSRTTLEGERLDEWQAELKVEAGGSDPFFIWPVTVVHRIDETSPLYAYSASDMVRSHFEIVVLMEGTIEATGQPTQARSSYTTNEIMWGHKFAPVVSYNADIQGYEIDYSKFDYTEPIEIPLCSAMILDSFYDALAEYQKLAEQTVASDNVKNNSSAGLEENVENNSLENSSETSRAKILEDLVIKCKNILDEINNINETHLV